MQEFARVQLKYIYPEVSWICDTWPCGTQQLTFWELRATGDLSPLGELLWGNVSCNSSRAL